MYGRYVIMTRFDRRSNRKPDFAVTLTTIDPHFPLTAMAERWEIP